MTTSTLTTQAQAVIDGYLRFKQGPAVCSIPYFNNKTRRSRSALNALVGKGTPREISDEVEMLVFKSHTKIEGLTDDSLKKLLTDQDIGIDCSALAYYILDAESQARDKGPMKKHLSFIQARGIKGFIAAKTRPVRLSDVETFANDANSRPIGLNEIAPGDIITMLDDSKVGERNHILTITQVDRDGDAPRKARYVHTVAYPTDGLYNTGIREGEIEIVDRSGTILDQVWREGGTIDGAAIIFARAQKSKTELRRMKWL
jgi:hypothetical protein